MASTSSLSSSSMDFDIAPWDDETNQFGWKGVHTRGLIIAGTVYIWIMPSENGILPFFDQTFDFGDSDYLTTCRRYHFDMHRPANAQHSMFQTLEWPSISCDTLDQHIHAFSYEPEIPIEPSSLAFRYLKGKPLDLKKHFDGKIRHQMKKPYPCITELMRETLNRFTGTIYEEVTDEVLFWIIPDPKALLEELHQVKNIILRNNVVRHC